MRSVFMFNKRDNKNESNDIKKIMGKPEKVLLGFT